LRIFLYFFSFFINIFRGVFGIKSKLNLNQNDMSRENYEKIILHAIDAKYKSLQSLYSVLTEEEFNLTKFLLRNKLLLDLQKQFDRIEEHVKSHIYFRQRNADDTDYLDRPLEMEVLTRAEAVLDVEIEDVRDLLKRILSGPMGIFHLGIHNCKLPDKL
jgi:predicted Zn-dependent peptidase